MADDVELNPGTGGKIVGAVEKSGKDTQVFALDLNGPGSEFLLTPGQKTMAFSIPVAIASDQPPPAGAATYGEQQTQTGLLSNLDDLDELTRAKVNLIVGQAGVQGGSGATSANTQRVVIATDQPPMTAATGTQTSVAGSATSVTILAANTSRRGAMIYNDSTAILYLRFSASAASVSAYTVKLFADDFYELPGSMVYTGPITGIWASTAGAAYVTELI